MSLGFGHQPREFFATDPGHELAVAAVRAQKLGAEDENAVAGLMAVLVVDGFEVVEVHEH